MASFSTHTTVSLEDPDLTQQVVSGLYKLEQMVLSIMLFSRRELVESHESLVDLAKEQEVPIDEDLCKIVPVSELVECIALLMEVLVSSSVETLKGLVKCTRKCIGRLERGMFSIRGKTQTSPNELQTGSE